MDLDEHEHIKFNLADVKRFAKTENRRIRARAASGWTNEDF